MICSLKFASSTPEPPIATNPICLLFSFSSTIIAPTIQIRVGAAEIALCFPSILAVGTRCNSGEGFGIKLPYIVEGFVVGANEFTKP